MRDLLFFDKMLTPKIITIVYWLILLGVALGALTTIFGGGFTIGKFFMGLIGAAFGALFARIWCELMIVLFKMNEALQEIRNK
ncbi:MAG: DUF4282 domain-containing protein [Deltaproteobacteria bacterium]|nr:DUF4282 domain-containing protein [Deltaproteobacteria bacterium]